MIPRPGTALAEALVTMVIGAVVCSAVAATLAGGERLARRQAERVAVAEATRTAITVLAGESRYIAPSADLAALARDSMLLRAFRGTAVACAVDGPATLVRYRGLREPEPAKDSVVVLGATGDARPVALAASGRVDAGCDLRAGEAIYRWMLAPRPEPGTPILLFESGSFHLADRAVRFRRGASGRQPLTAPVFVDRSSGFTALDAGGTTVGSAGAMAWFELDLVADPPTGERSPSPPRPVRARWRLLNGDPRVEERGGGR